MKQITRSTEDDTSRAAVYWRRPGVALATLLGAYLLVNVVQAGFAPDGFAERMGLGSDSETAAWVQVYAGRTFVLAAILLLLVIRRQLGPLAAALTIAVVLPLTDALLTWQAGARAGTVSRHLMIAAVVLVVAALVHRDDRRLFHRGRQSGQVHRG